ncbi:hypothetical protein [Pseudogemmobacter bohemicus]|uniref:hypothetical protein n=1 Tax=Pseudogemmobacter bohemicus TaxID=2250708 RepID=UPI0013006DC8|nr:hypothetical protein [Pseudogemmobacter bohemicus]
MDVSRETLQGLCALHVTLARMDGHQIDKKAARFSAMADYCQQSADAAEITNRR